MRMKNAWSILLLGFVTWSAAASVLALELGDSAPPLKIAKWVKGGPVDIGAGKGKNIFILDMWATWCGPCIEGMPHLSALQKKYADQGVVVVGISSEERKTVEDFVMRNRSTMAYTVAVDDARQTNDAYMRPFFVTGIPHAFVIDKAGRLVWHGHPRAGLEMVLEDLIAGTFDLEAFKKEEVATRRVSEYVTMVQAGEEPAKADQMGEAIVRDLGNRAALMNRLAMRLILDPSIKHRNLDMIMGAAQAAYDATKGQDPYIIDTLARAFAEKGNFAKAIDLEKQAIALCKNEKQKPEMEETLKEFVAKAEQAKK